MEVYINERLCKGCEFCVKYCPKQVLEMGKGRNKKGDFIPVTIREDRCDDCIVCANCALMCPEGAIEVTEKEAAV